MAQNIKTIVISTSQTISRHLKKLFKSKDSFSGNDFFRKFSKCFQNFAAKYYKKAVLLFTYDTNATIKNWVFIKVWWDMFILRNAVSWNNKITTYAISHMTHFMLWRKSAKKVENNEQGLSLIYKIILTSPVELWRQRPK